MSRVRIFGIGSPYGADCVGWQAAELLQINQFVRRYPEGQVAIESFDRPGISLITAMRGAEMVILVDAMVAESEPGTLRRVESADLIRRADSLSTHSVGVAEALALGEALGDLPLRVVLFGVEMEGLEPEDDSWYPLLEGALHRELDAWFGDGVVITH